MELGDSTKLEQEMTKMDMLRRNRLKFLKMFQEIGLEKKIAEFTDIIEEERKWFTKNNLGAEFTKICAENERLVV